MNFVIIIIIIIIKKKKSFLIIIIIIIFFFQNKYCFLDNFIFIVKYIIVMECSHNLYSVYHHGRYSIDLISTSFGAFH